MHFKYGELLVTTLGFAGRERVRFACLNAVRISSVPCIIRRAVSSAFRPPSRNASRPANLMQEAHLTVQKAERPNTDAPYDFNIKNYNTTTNKNEVRPSSLLYFCWARLPRTHLLIPGKQNDDTPKWSSPLDRSI